MEPVTMKQLLEAGVHFGHHKRRWNPKMKRFIFTERNGIYILDLKRTNKMLRDAYLFVRDAVADGDRVLFVGTKKQAKDPIREAAVSCGMYYVNNRWLGGMLTNFRTVRRSVMRMISLKKMVEDGTIEKYSKKEISMLLSELGSLEKNLEGVKKMEKLPDLLFIVDPSNEEIAVKEAKRLKIPIVAVVDTNCDPDPIDVIIPANDDAIRAIKLMASKMAEACVEGVQARLDAGLMTEEEADFELPARGIDESALVDTEAKYGVYRDESEQLEEAVDYGGDEESAPEDLIAEAERRASEAEEEARRAEEEARKLMEQVRQMGGDAKISVSFASVHDGAKNAEAGDSPAPAPAEDESATS